MQAQAPDRLGPVNENLGPDLVNANFGPGPVNTNWGAGPGLGAKQKAECQEIQRPADSFLIQNIK